MILNFGTLEVDNILCKETVEIGIDFVYKCLISQILQMSNKLGESLIPNEQ